MRCSVPSCTKTTKNHGVTFHLFPKEPDIRSAWLEALGLSAWVPKEKSSICSEHFKNDDLYDTKTGLRKLKSGAVPVSPDTNKDLDAPADMRVCRICLATDTKMFSTSDNQFDKLYSDLIGIYINDDRLPQKLCWECTHRLHSYHKFKSKAISSRDLLLSILRGSQYITINDIKSINRAHHRLNSNLIQKILHTTNPDIHIDEEEIIIKPEATENEKIELEETVEEKEELKEDVEVSTVEVKEEDKSNEIFVDEYLEDNIIDNNFDSEDDMKLSEVKCDKVKKKVGVKVKKRKIKEDKTERIEKKKEAEDSDDSPVQTADKYKNTNIKRRRTNDGLNESLFTIVTLSYEEQIAEIEKRKDSSSYVNSTYKCTQCFRGFPFKDRYDAHILRHSDQAGAYECFICKTRLKSSRALRKHVTAQHTEQYMCKGCPFITRNRGVAREHEKWHSGTRYQCPHCPSEFDKLTTYMGHLRIKHVSSFVCALCGYTFVSKKGVDVHMKKKHRLSTESVSLEGPYCEVCEVKFVSEEAHARHLKLSSKHSSDDDPNRIRNDSQSVGRLSGNQPRVNRPFAIERKQPNERVTCEQCGLELRDLRIYAQHFRRAHPDKNRTKYPAMKTPFMCELCGRIFQSMALLKDHNWVHTGVKRFKCDRCDKSFTQKTNLVFHLRTHGNNRPLYPCNVCGKHFAFFNNRRRHMFIHTGLKPYSCGACGKSFTTAGEQRAHHDHVHLKKPWPRRARRPNEVNSANESLN